MKQVNLTLTPTDLSQIDAAVTARNKARPAGHPAWSRNAFMVAAALKEAKREAADSLEVASGQRADDSPG